MGIKKYRRKLVAPDFQTGAGTIGTTELADDAVTNAKIGALAVDTAEIAADAVTNAKLGPVQPKALKFQYDFADLGGAQGAITLTDDADDAQTIPDNALILRAYIEGVTSSTSGGSATVKLGITGDDDAFIAATAFDNGEFDAGVLTELSAGIPIKTSAAVSVLATIATADMTAGKYNIWVEYMEGD
jgi:hypothetical protein